MSVGCVADHAVHCRLRWCGAGNMDWEAGGGFVRHYGHIILRFASRKYRCLGLYIKCRIIVCVSVIDRRYQISLPFVVTSARACLLTEKINDILPISWPSISEQHNHRHVVGVVKAPYSRGP